MNKLLFSEGGQPLNLDDLEFMQTSTIDAIKALASPWGNCVLTGNWAPTFHSGGGVMAWEDCMVSINGKLAFLPASRLDVSSIQSSSEVSAYIEIFGQEDGRKNFADGSQHPTRMVYRAEMKVGALPVGGDVLPVLKKRLFGGFFGESVGGFFVKSGYLIEHKIKSYMAVSETDVAVGKVREGVSIRLKIKDVHGIRILFGEIGLDYAHGAIADFDGYICTLGDTWQFQRNWRALLDGYMPGLRDVAFVVCKDMRSVSSLSSPDEIRIVNASGEAPSRLETGTYSFQCILP